MAWQVGRQTRAVPKQSGPTHHPPWPSHPLQAFVVSLLLTQVFKVMVGRLRPNFLARCAALC